MTRFLTNILLFTTAVLASGSLLRGKTRFGTWTERR